MITSMVAALLLAGSVADSFDDQLPPDFAMSVQPRRGRVGSASGSGTLGTRTRGGLLGVDSLSNWQGSFYNPGISGLPYPFPQYTWQYYMVGNSPYASNDGARGDGKTTYIRAPIVPIDLDLRTPDGSPRFFNGHPLVTNVGHFVDAVVQSPIFSPAQFDSSDRPTQFTDAILRAEFYGVADKNWHTILQPVVATPRTIVINQAAPAPGNTSCVQDNSCNYRFMPYPDGTCCLGVIVADAVFYSLLGPAAPGDTTTPIGAAENSGEMTTRDITTLLFDSVYLYPAGGPELAFFLGYHSIDVEPGDATNGWRERDYVYNVSSWLKRDFFGAPPGSCFDDVCVLSHEMAELFNDPLVLNLTPWYLAPNGFVCQDILETGDVIESLPNQTFLLTLNGYTYNLQNEALLQWFAGQSPSSAIHGAYSYPDTNVLTSPMTSVTPAVCGF
jgi:hypothetical protein